MAALAFTVIALRAQDAPLRASLPPNVLAVLEVPSPAAAVEQLGRALGPVPADLSPELRLQLALGYNFVLAFVGGDLAAFAGRVAGRGFALGLWRGPGGVEPFALALPGEPEAAAGWLQQKAGKLTWRRDGERLWWAPSAAGLAALAPDVAPVQRPTAAADAAATAWLDLAALRAAYPKPPAFAALDGGGRVLLGPLLAVLDAAPALVLTLRGGDELALHAEVAVAVPERLRPYLQDSAVGFDGVPGLLFAWRHARSLHALLDAPEPLLGADGVADVRAFLAIADLLEGTASFTDDLVGGFAEAPRLLLFEPEPPGDEQGPIVLPQLAMVVRCESAAARRSLALMWSTFGLIANVERGKVGKLPFRFRTWRSELGEGYTAEMAAWRGPGLPPVDASVRPTLLFGAEGVALATTPQAADRALQALAADRGATTTGDVLLLRGRPLADLIGRNRDLLVWSRQLDEGEDQVAAARFTDALAVLARELGELQLQVEYGDARTVLRARLRRAR